MNTVNSLLEGASPYRVQANQAAKLAGKWNKSGLLEGIDSSTEKNNMAMLLENQAKQLVNEANTTGTDASFSSGNSEAWAGVALPLVRRVFGEIVAKDLVSVQPMNLPAGLIFYLDFQYGDAMGGRTVGESLYGASTDLTRTTGSFDTGLYGSGRFAYTSNDFTSSLITQVYGRDDGSTGIARTSSVDFGGIAQLDTDWSSSVTANTANSFGTADPNAVDNVVTLIVSRSIMADPDLEGVRGFEISGTGIEEYYPQFTRIQSGSMIEFVVRKTAAATIITDATITYQKGPDNLDNVGDFEDSDANTSTSQGFTNSSLEIPTIDVQLKSDTVAAKTRKLKAQWTPEFAQDLNAYHSIDAEAELTSILSEYISMEIDLEILDMLITNADTVEGWSAKVAQDVTVSGLGGANTTQGGTETGTFTSAAATEGVYYTKMSWFQTLGIKLQKVSNIIHQKTLRGGANWMVISPKMSTVMESIPGFAADSSGDDDKYNMGVQKVGAINNRYTVYKNPYMVENTILMGYKGSQFLETGAVFAPYIPLIMTPLVYDPNSFTPRKGIMTRYAKKMVRPDFYGKVIVADMDQI
jgi:hypothetical protein